jgi:L-threonylcarbamoyladenylate synthase
MGASFSAFKPYLDGSGEEMAIWQQFAAQYWPGALTLVLPASGLLPKAMNPNNFNTIGIRVPNLKIAQDILSQTGPLATTSANLSGQEPLRTIEAIQEQFSEVLTLDRDYLGSGQPSTVAKWTNQSWQILRQGSVKL